MKKYKNVLIGVAVFVGVVLGFQALNAHIYNEKQASAPESVPLTVSGIVVCLPHKGPGPHSKECMIGLMAPDRTHYGLDLSRITIMEGLQVSDRITVRGELVAPEEDGKYDTVGTISVIEIPE